ncbi:MAG: ferrochelatase [Psychrobacter glaciei]|jgi:ferrochelatase|uniref:Ferrochelatase n=3 Tax=Gammaproteobacteria TaxID=1236 RepID=A0ABQ3GQ13_9GAMM|nr:MULTISPECIES: ferrochelatase [Psychrobacter]MBF4490862.1 ferrochelatase [Psychrobacter sp. N25K4-3-2]MCH1783225.1 ferrochelatase [Psychrobacter glaciei]GHD29732.1 ferrochelatase [Psychrobacter glaciei]
MKPKLPPRIAVLLVNLGTPDEPTAPAVRRYLKQFLSDPRVIEIPKFLWAIILNLFVLPSRPKRVAEAYASIWDGDSPMRNILNQQVAMLDTRLAEQAAPFRVSVHSAMSYGNPGLPDVMDKLRSEGVDHFVMLPVFPQYSATSTGAVYDAITKWSLKQRNLPNITIVKDYFAHPLYIKALADSIRRFQAVHGKPDKLMFSFHGIPQPYMDKGDPYPRRCKCTAAQVAQALGLKDDEWIISFQSRFGKQEWVKPYTDVILDEWAKSGVKSVQILSPAFSADCLETLEELAIENRENFLHAGGQEYHYIPALNADEAHIDLLEAMSAPLVKGWAGTLDGWA